MAAPPPPIPIDKKARTKQELEDKSIAQKLTYGPSVTSSMTAAGALFASLTAKIEAAETATEELDEAKEAADNARAASEAATDVQHTKVLAYDSAFTELGRGVDDVAKGDKTIIDKAAMESFFPGKASPIGELPQVKNLSLTIGDNEGELDGHFDKVKGASSYNIEKAITNPENWMHAASSTKTSFTLSGLGSGVKIWVRVSALGSAGQGPWSDPAFKFTP